VFEQKLQQQIGKPAKTRDDSEIELLANVDFIHEVSDVKQNKADGIGLFRTEGIFIESKKTPSEEQQFKVYKKLAQDMAPNPVVIRTIDLGGDKLIEGFGPEEEMNPFLGWRAIRFCLDSPKVFKTQLRAMLRASVFGSIKILVPMVCCIHEIVETRRFISEIQAELRDNKIPFDPDVPIGIMIETPAAAVMAKAFTQYADFFSIGTNDLTQYVLAIDRTNSKVAQSFNSFHPAVIELIGLTIKEANNKNIPVSLCGEFAAVPEAIPILLGMGLKSFSVNPYYLPKVKKIIRSFDVTQCQKLYKRVRRMHCADDIEHACKTSLMEAIPDLEYLN
jgi:phosphotransferase system enzyme I (PtsI)